MVYNTLTLVLAIVMGFVLYDLYTILENQEDLYSMIRALRSQSDEQLLLTR
jgi:hypothetical protein